VRKEKRWEAGQEDRDVEGGRGRQGREGGRG